MTTKYLIDVDNLEYNVKFDCAENLYSIPVLLPTSFKDGVKPSLRKATLCAAASVTSISTDFSQQDFFDVYAVVWRETNYLVILPNSSEAEWYCEDSTFVAFTQDDLKFAIKQYYRNRERVIIKSCHTLI